MAFSGQYRPSALSKKGWLGTMYDMALAKATSKILIIDRSFTHYLIFLTDNWGNYYFSWVQLIRILWDRSVIFWFLVLKSRGYYVIELPLSQIFVLISDSARLFVYIFAVFAFLSEIEICLVCMWKWEAMLLLAANYLLSDPNCAALAFNQLYLNQTQAENMCNYHLELGNAKICFEKSMKLDYEICI